MHKILIAVNGNFECQIRRLKEAGFEVYQKSISSYKDEKVVAEEISSFNCIIVGGGPWNANVLKYAKEKGSSITGPKDMNIEYINIIDF